MPASHKDFFFYINNVQLYTAEDDITQKLNAQIWSQFQKKEKEKQCRETGGVRAQCQGVLGT